MTDRPEGSAAADVPALVLAVQASAPAALRALPQWLLWRFELYEGDKKPRKVPYYASGRKRHGEQGSEHDRAELKPLDIVLTHLARGRFDGVGFAFLPGDGLIGIDIDGAIDDDGVVSERCERIIAACASYTELSPSGRGVHIICSGQTETFKDNRVGVEVFCGRQYFTFTGRRWEGTPEDVRPIEEATLRRLRATVRQGKAKAVAPASAPVAPPPRDDFKRINTMALALLDAWVPQLFPTAKKTALGYRVPQKDLGRDLQEDLSITPQGIKDWGVRDQGDPKAGGRTAIDLVVEWRGLTPAEALHWLADCLGVRLEQPARGAAAAGAGRAKRRKGASTPNEGSAGEGEGPPPADPPAGAPPPPPKEDGWRRQLLRREGGLKDCRENVFLLLTNHPTLKGLVGYDEFSHRVMKLRPPPWDSEPGEWSTNDDYLLGYWLAQHERMSVKAEATLVAGVAMAAFAARFHPVLQYLDALPEWDGTPRLGHWLHECMGAEDSDYSRLVGTWFLMGMVRRVREPGCQMDYMVVFEGLQGKRKSTALRTLAVRDEWFADTPIRIGDKDALLSLAGIWLYEIGELDAFNKAEVTAVKQYLSSRIDRVREPFARRPTDRKRSGVFGGSTNQTEYFKDPTGARRFWPVACDGDIDLDKLRSWRDQLFAEAQHRLRSADPEERRCWPTRAEEDEYLVPQQERREIVDPWFEKLATWLDSKAQFGDSVHEVREVKSFTAFELLTRCLMVPQDRIDGGRQMATRVGIAMHKLGWVKHRDSTGPRVWRYWRPGTAPEAAHRSAGASGGPDVQAGGVEVKLDEF